MLVNIKRQKPGVHPSRARHLLKNAMISKDYRFSFCSMITSFGDTIYGEYTIHQNHFSILQKYFEIEEVAATKEDYLSSYTCKDCICFQVCKYTGLQPENYYIPKMCKYFKHKDACHYPATA